MKNMDISNDKHAFMLSPSVFRFSLVSTPPNSFMPAVAMFVGYD